MVFHGSGSSGYGRSRHRSDFKPEYFLGGLAILVPLYFYLYYEKKKEKEGSFPLKYFNREIVVEDIKRYKRTENISLNNVTIESYIFGVGKDQNDYVNIFYHSGEIEFVKTKITIEVTQNNSTKKFIAFTNLDHLKVKEIFKSQISTTIYFDKYIPANYYLDLEFLTLDTLK